MPEPTDPNLQLHVQFAVWIGEDAEEGEPGHLRETLRDVPVGRPFDVAMRLMRDEGWDVVTIIRTRHDSA